jgi:hypothetical protein
MAHLAFVVAKSGSGKSTSLRNCPPESTVIVNTDQKPLPFKKFQEKFSEEKGNYLKSSDTNAIIAKLKEAHKNPDVKIFVIDTWSRVMTDFVMSPAFRSDKGFDKWAKLSGGQYDLLNTINEKVRDDMNVYLMCHPETFRDESGFEVQRIAVQGKQLEKFAPESFSSIVIYAEKIPGGQGKPTEFKFRTHSTGDDTCKTPMDMFEEDLIDNDIMLIDKAIREYY